MAEKQTISVALPQSKECVYNRHLVLRGVQECRGPRGRMAPQDPQETRVLRYVFLHVCAYDISDELMLNPPLSVSGPPGTQGREGRAGESDNESERITRSCFIDAHVCV